ncbi:carbohydrate sulfotransferase 15-like isoform X2 [Physella acuta]|uniref:carbohydrate sulfotransferase 15-like isoform X2 n=1 Tax=Physella acuta TaxID=109671 RepID=UPI0027DE934D|nr:carbohydrate sulfotransferase 15-like isoform X2 [Physella acuta]
MWSSLSEIYRDDQDLNSGIRDLKGKSRCLLAVLCCRMIHPRCHLRNCLIVILLFVSLTLVYFSFHGHQLSKVDRAPPEAESHPLVTPLFGNIENSKPKQDTKRRNVSETQGKHPKKSGSHKKGKHGLEAELEGDSWGQVSDVISLMARFNSQNQTVAAFVNKDVLMKQIEVLREAMLSEKSVLPTLGGPPACMNGLKTGEVEDLLCIPKPKYLTHIKNPCWYEDETVDGVGIPKLRCLPYFHILGCAKSGTTDLWDRLMSHPHIISNDGVLQKEALWWSWRRYGFSGYKRVQPSNFSQYVNLFEDTARQVQASIDKGTLYHQILITGDASPPDFWDFRGWTNISQNRNYNVPRVVTPHLMKHFYENPKFILMFRDPIERLYSDYFFVGGGLTSLDFHNDVLAAIDMVYNCVKRNGMERCFYDRELYSNLPVRLPFACYSVFMREWLRVFPLKNFLLIKTEEYRDDPEETLKRVMEFLGLGPLKDAVLQEIAEEERSRVTLQRKIAGDMKNTTREILHLLLDPCSKELARLVQDDKFNWVS